ADDRVVEADLGGVDGIDRPDGGHHRIGHLIGVLTGPALTLLGHTQVHVGSMNPGSSQFPPASTMRAPSRATTSGPSSMIEACWAATMASKAGEVRGRTWALVIARTVMRSTLALPRENGKQDTAVGCRRVGPAGARLRRIRAREHPAGVDTACA